MVPLVLPLLTPNSYSIEATTPNSYSSSASSVYFSSSA